MKHKKYRLSIKERVQVLCIFVIADMVISYLFYDSIIAAFILSPMIVPVWIKYGEYCEHKWKRELKYQFVQAMVNVAGALSAGLSVENAFIDASKQIDKLYGNSSFFARELRIVAFSQNASKKIEDSLADFAARTDIEEIRDLSDIFQIVGRGCGDYAKVIENCIEVIQKSIEVTQEIETHLSGKKFEMRIMSIIPLSIVAYLKLSAPALLEVLYHNLFGVVVMTACMSVYFAAVLISEKICNISY